MLVRGTNHSHGDVELVNFGRGFHANCRFFRPPRARKDHAALLALAVGIDRLLPPWFLGADPTIKNAFGETALSWAKRLNYESVVNVLAPAVMRGFYRG